MQQRCLCWQLHIRPLCFDDRATQTGSIKSAGLWSRSLCCKRTELEHRWSHNLDEYLGVGTGGEGLHEGASDDGEVADEAALQGIEVLLDEVRGAVVRGEAAGEAVVVEVVVLAQVGVARHAVEGARHVGGDAQAVLVDQAVLLAGHTRPKPAQADPLSGLAMQY